MDRRRRFIRTRKLVSRACDAVYPQQAMQASDNFPRELLQSLHCGVSPSLPVTASLTPYWHVDMRNIDFLLSRYVGKSLNHLKVTERVNVQSIKWANSVQSNAVIIYEPSDRGC